MRLFAKIIVLLLIVNFVKSIAFNRSSKSRKCPLCTQSLKHLSSTKNIVGIIIGLAPGLVGYIIIMIQVGATVRDNIPKDKVGLFQGIRMIFLFFVPMIIGPTLGNIAAKNSDVSYMENGTEKMLPTEAMFLYAAIVAMFIFIPMLAFLKKDKEKSLKENNE